MDHESLVERFVDRVKERPVATGLFLVGVVCLGVGWWSWPKASRVGEVQVEIIKAEEPVEETDSEVVVDVAGAVERPGLYSVSSGERVGSVIEMAGGFGKKSDLEYVAQQINLAQKVSDGMKIYIPFEGEEIIEPNGGGAVTNTKVNVNTASKSQLEQLWGIGEARAQAIIDHRPYANQGELKEKASLPESVIESIGEAIEF